MSLISHIDHLVLTVSNIEQSCAFYTTVLQMEEINFKGRKALKFGHSKINLHEVGHEFEPKAMYPREGSSDICLITQMPISNFIEYLKRFNVEILEGACKSYGGKE